MKFLIPLTFFLFIKVTTFGQVTTQIRSVQYREAIDWKQTKLVNEKTGKQMSEKDYADLVKAYPSLVLKRSINKFGNLDTLFFDPENIKTDGWRHRNVELQPKEGEVFPEFVF
jgi:hypothetical protein